MLSLPQTLSFINDAREAWPFDEDPGVGEHDFGDFLLCVTEHDSKKKGEISTRYVLKHREHKADPLSMSYNWNLFTENMNRPPSNVLGEAEGIDMTAKSAMHDDDMREQVRLKCRNDWDLELNEDQVSVCIMEMEKQRLSLFHNQIWPNERRYKKNDQWRSRVTWDKTIDGYRAIAHRTGLFAGVDAPGFTFEKNDDGNEDMVARVTVYRLGPDGKRHAFVGEARYSEFVQLVDEWEDRKKTGKKVPNHKWADSPRNQLAVAAERQALRKAFQDCEDAQAIAFPMAETATPAPEPSLEESRGAPVHQDEAPAASALAPEPAPAEEKKEEKPKGDYVGIPKSGFVLFSKYNKKERIIMLIKKDGRTILALDSGQRVTVSDDGYEVDRRDRTDEYKGGRQWEVGDQYYEGEEVLKTAPSKADEWALRLLLDSGHEVRVDRWGLETKRKERDVKKSENKSEKPANVEHDDRVGGQVIDTTAEPADSPSGANAPGDNGVVDVEGVQDVAGLRKVTGPLLKKWCMEVVNQRMSYKQAYSQLTGVVLNKGQEMSLDDYKVLYECLDEAIKEHEGK